MSCAFLSLPALGCVSFRYCQVECFERSFLLIRLFARFGELPVECAAKNGRIRGVTKTLPLSRMYYRRVTAIFLKCLVFWVSALLPEADVTEAMVNFSY